MSTLPHLPTARSRQDPEPATEVPPGPVPPVSPTSAPPTSAPPTSMPPGRAARALAVLRRPPVPTVLFTLAVGLGVLARLHSPATLWLDEALSLGIARRPVPELLQALRRDGSPPLYYLLLHVWTLVVGVSPLAVRALSAVLSLAALPVVLAAGRRTGGPATGRTAVLLLAVCPFAVRYATETRMYALVQLLSALLLLALLRARERPDLARLAPVSVLSAALALTHYWALFLLAVTAAGLLVLARRGSPASRRACGRSLVALAGGGVLFLPWAPTFLFQIRHTGTPWAPTPRLADLWWTLTAWSGGASGAAVVLSLLLAGLVLLAVVGRSQGGAVVLGGRLDRPALALLAGAFGTVLLGLLAGMLVHAGYSPRYSSVALVPGLLLAALGARALPAGARATVLALVAVAGLAGSLPQLGSTSRTQAAHTAQALRAVLQPGDVVAYCPDQLGPAVSRLLPRGTDQVAYPDLSDPGLVDWVDYAQRNAAASPGDAAARLAARTRGAVYLVSQPGYLTFGTQCEQLGQALRERRGEGVVVQASSRRYEEPEGVVRYPPAR